jgi:heme-degrading monooxygenase HmoA
MHAVIRRYNIQEGMAQQISQRVTDGFLPIVSGVRGFVSYHVINPEDGTIASVSIFTDRAAADESNKLAADWVKQNLAHMVKTAPVILSGEVVVEKRAK